MKYKFICSPEDGETGATNTVEFSAEIWDDVLSYVKPFLQGAGFVFSEQNYNEAVEDHFDLDDYDDEYSATPSLDPVQSKQRGTEQEWRDYVNEVSSADEARWKTRRAPSRSDDSTGNQARQAKSRCTAELCNCHWLRSMNTDLEWLGGMDEE